MTGNTAAITAAGRALAAARRERDELAARGGPEAVAEAAAPNGSDEEKDALAAQYQHLSQQAQTGGDTAA
jgi:hypothetical protein